MPYDLIYELSPKHFIFALKPESKLHLWKLSRNVEIFFQHKKI